MAALSVDGNFKAELLKMINPDDDVNLFNGQGFLVERDRYHEHLNNSPDPAPVRDSLAGSCCASRADREQERSTCHEHRAVSQANKDRSNLSVTGIGAVSCARHGCFVPHSVVDFQKGER